MQPVLFQLLLALLIEKFNSALKLNMTCHSERHIWLQTGASSDLRPKIGAAYLTLALYINRYRYSFNMRLLQIWEI